MAKRYYRGWVTEGNYAAETAKAYGFEVGTGRFSGRTFLTWIPKSRVRWGEYADGTNNRMMYIPCWLLDSKGIAPDRLLDVRFDRDIVVEL